MFTLLHLSHPDIAQSIHIQLFDFMGFPVTSTLWVVTTLSCWTRTNDSTQLRKLFQCSNHALFTSEHSRSSEIFLVGLQFKAWAKALDGLGLPQPAGRVSERKQPTVSAGPAWQCAEASGTKSAGAAYVPGEWHHSMHLKSFFASDLL